MRDQSVGTPTRCVLRLAGLPKSLRALDARREFGPKAGDTAQPHNSAPLFLSNPQENHQKIDDKCIDNHPPRSRLHADNHAVGQ
jgi:hypothetical protein